VTGWVLALNAGSSSLKLAAFDAAGERRLASGILRDVDVAALPEAAMTDALAALLRDAGQTGAPRAMGHRVVHGLDQRHAAEISGGVLELIERAAVFAPLHNPPALRVIALARARYPEARQVACFDTAFHAANPPEAVTFAIPDALREAGIRRYGFHGLSYADLVRRFGSVTGQRRPRRLLAAHLGAGCSLAAILEGQGVATTMGFSPMDGLVMATRSGAMDPGVIFHLIRDGHAPYEVETLLNRASGLLALGGTISMQELLARDDAAARFALDHFAYWAIRHAGGMIAAMGGIDAIAFTGGIGENAGPLRDRITAGLGWAGIGSDNSFVIPADEEAEIARAVAETAR
jgi:acetate kinase